MRNRGLKLWSVTPLLLFVVTLLSVRVTAQNTAAVLPSREPAELGDWYKPPEFVVPQRPYIWTREFVPNDKEKRLAGLKPPSDRTVADKLFAKNLFGYQLNDFKYGLRAPAVVNNTYVLRSMLSRRADQLIAFRIVRIDEDNSVTIVWKKLQDYPTPGWDGNHGSKR